MLYFVSVLKGMDLSDYIIQFYNFTDNGTKPQRREMTSLQDPQFHEGRDYNYFAYIVGHTTNDKIMTIVGAQ